MGCGQSKPDPYDYREQPRFHAFHCNQSSCQLSCPGYDGRSETASGTPEDSHTDCDALTWTDGAGARRKRKGGTSGFGGVFTGGGKLLVLTLFG